MSKKKAFLPDLSSRVNMPELMDDPDSDPQLLANTLSQFRTLNLYFSPVRRLLKKHVLKTMSRQPEREYHLVDLGAGSCETAAWLLGQAQRKGLRLRITACDHDQRVIQYASNKYGTTRNLSIRLRHALDIDDLQPMDFVWANHLFHHLSDLDIHRLLGSLARLEKSKVIICDIHRSRLIYAGFHLISSALFRNSFVHDDGLLSIRKGFTERELRKFAVESMPRSTACQLKKMFPGHIVLLTKPDFRSSIT